MFVNEEKKVYDLPVCQPRRCFKVSTSEIKSSLASEQAIFSGTRLFLKALLLGYQPGFRNHETESSLWPFYKLLAAWPRWWGILTSMGPSLTSCDLHHIGRLSFSRSQIKRKKLILDFQKDLRQRAFWEGFGKYWPLSLSFDLLLEQRLRNESWEQNGGPVNQDLQKETRKELRLILFLCTLYWLYQGMCLAQNHWWLLREILKRSQQLMSLSQWNLRNLMFTPSAPRTPSF